MWFQPPKHLHLLVGNYVVFEFEFVFVVDLLVRIPWSYLDPRL